MTSGASKGTSGARQRLPWRTIAVMAVFTAAITTINVLSVLHDVGPRLNPLEPVVWEYSSGVLVILLLPYLLVPLYRVVNPVSTLMLWRWAHGQRVERSYVPIDRMAPALPITVIA